MNSSFRTINTAYNHAFKPGMLSFGLCVPIESYPASPVPLMDRFVERVQLAEACGFSSIWLRDVPFNVPTFGDAGQIYDPFVSLGLLAGATQRIGLGVASIILPLRHPAHVAKAAASVDVLSGGRLLLGIASGDRPEEFPALNMGFADRGERFRESYEYIRHMADDYPAFNNTHGTLIQRADMLPKPTGGRIPLLITGGSQQSPEWVAEHGDGWMTYPRNVDAQTRLIEDYRSRVAETGAADSQGADQGECSKPVMQSLYIDLVSDYNAEPRPIHLGFQSGVNYLRMYLQGLRTAGINHVALNLRFNHADIEDTIKRLGDELLPEFACSA
jgi:luciferase-type oxidoreductase